MQNAAPRTSLRLSSCQVVEIELSEFEFLSWIIFSFRVFHNFSSWVLLLLINFWNRVLKIENRIVAQNLYIDPQLPSGKCQVKYLEHSEKWGLRMFCDSKYTYTGRIVRKYKDRIGDEHKCKGWSIKILHLIGIDTFCTRKEKTISKVSAVWKWMKLTRETSFQVHAF